MASSSQALPGADRIRSLKDEDAVFQAFDSYPWKKDPMFMSGLNAILGDPSTPNPNSSPRDMATHARIFYYSQRIGTAIDFAAYQSWLDRNPQHQPPDILPDSHARASPQNSSLPSSASSSALPWQSAATKVDLFIDKSKQSADAAAATARPSDVGAGEPSYPMGFAEMIRLLQEGKEIPGIRQIPNTIAREPSTKPVGSRLAPRKPWERESPAQPLTAELGNVLDSEFPPVETNEAS